MPGSWSLLQNPGPFTEDSDHAADAMILLTDASILIHDLVPGNGWWRLYPAADGFYDNGTWTGPFNMEYQRTAFASGIMMDGRLFVLGGEHSNDPNDVAEGGWSPTWEIFDPTTNIWTPQPKPIQGTSNFNYIGGDASSCVLPDGRILFGSFEDNKSAIFDPKNQNSATQGWAEAGLVLNSSGILAPSRSEDCNEETWTLLPDGSVITVCTFDYAPGTDRATLRYLPDSDLWVSAGQTLQEFPTSNQEMGPAILLPNGTLFAIGATGNTGIYTPPAVMSEPGTWSLGPPLTLNNVPQGCSDGPAVLMPSGLVLCVGGPIVGSGENLNTTPASFFEYDYTTNMVQHGAPVARQLGPEWCLYRYIQNAPAADRAGHAYQRPGPDRPLYAGGSGPAAVLGAGNHRCSFWLYRRRELHNLRTATERLVPGSELWR